MPGLPPADRERRGRARDASGVGEGIGGQCLPAAGQLRREDAAVRVAGAGRVDGLDGERADAPALGARRDDRSLGPERHDERADPLGERVDRRPRSGRSPSPRDITQLVLVHDEDVGAESRPSASPRRRRAPKARR